MKDVKKKAKRIGGLANPIIPAIYALFGMGLLIAPEISNRIVCFALAALLTLGGIYYIISYMRSDKATSFMRQDMTLGLTLLTGGAALFAMPTIPAGALPFVWSSALIVGGFAKLQAALDMRRLGISNWWHCLIGAGIALILGILSMLDPFDSGIALMRFIGGSMVAEALMDGYCGCMYMKRRKSQRSQPNDRPDSRPA